MADTPGERVQWAIVVAFLLAAAVCFLVPEVFDFVQDQGTQAVHVFRNAWWTPIVAVLGGGAATAGGWTLRTFSIKLSVGMIFLGIILAAVMAPSLLQEEVVVSGEGFRIKSGIWGLTDCNSMRFDEIREIWFADEKDEALGDKHAKYILTCAKKTRGSTKLSVRNAMTRAAASAIVDVARQQGIPVRDETASQ